MIHRTVSNELSSTVLMKGEINVALTFTRNREILKLLKADGFYHRQHFVKCKYNFFKKYLAPSCGAYSLRHFYK